MAQGICAGRMRAGRKRDAHASSRGYGTCTHGDMRSERPGAEYDTTGLTNARAERLLAEHGPNALPETAPLPL